MLDSARRLFPEHGYQGTSIEMITEAAGYGTGTFYTYFSSKTDIFRTLYGEGIKIFHTMVKEAHSWPGMTAPSKLSAIAGAYHRFHKDHRDYYDILSILHLRQKDFEEHHELLDYVIETGADLLKTIQGVLVEGMDRGEITPIDPWKATCFLWGMMDGVMLLEERKNLDLVGLNLEDIIKQGMEIVLYGMLPGKKADPET